jgi:hypothetical protein
MEAAIHQGDVERVTLGESVAKNSGGGTYSDQYSEGRIIAPDPQDSDKYHPVVKDTVQSGISGTTDIPVGKVEEYETGMWVQIPADSKGADGFREVTSIDEANDEITVGGANLSLSSGDDLIVDPSRAHDAVQDAGSGTGDTLTVNDASKFEAGSSIHIGPTTFKLVLEVDGYSDGFYQSVLYLNYGGTKLVSVAQYDASSDDANTVATQLSNDFGDQIAAATVNVQNTNEIHIDVTVYSTALGKIEAWQFSTLDPSGELTVDLAKQDIGHFAEVESADEGANTITLVNGVGWTNGEQIVTEPRDKHEVLKMANGTEGVIAAFEQVDKSSLKGLTDEAEANLENLRLKD